MTSPADLIQMFKGEIKHDIGVLLNEWKHEMRTISIDMAKIVRELSGKEPGEPQPFSIACLIGAYSGPVVACGGIKVLLFPLLPTINRRFPEEDANWVYHLMISQIMEVLWKQPVKRKLLESAVYEDSEELDDNPLEDEARLDEMLSEAIPKGTLEWLLLGVRIEEGENSA